ncbi:TIGR03752 family integrating conjugative element protein [Xenorhabdus lircayensis]|uniref:TIGR03752 family integrating conjugative element protein n=1 Tax=Xenorhabdus lircayensis TaxID=2763499 RepID=A0ABS0U790_9GAMM|nr:TIGR03752 family integrating conjugative element protein [Xenorhabdus lircayensis]MBI6549751.1 TIGR03752 family integrating conjugative element protein [Xenorhabdus lircayensis]
MQIKSNSLVKVLVPAVLMVGGFIGIKSCSSTDTVAPATPPNNALASLSPEELQALGIGGDTPEDTLRTLVGTLNKVRAEQQRLSRQNADILKENDQLKNQHHDVAGQIDAAVATLRQADEQRQRELQDEQQGLLAQIDLLTERLNSTPLSAPDSPVPLGAGIDPYSANTATGQGDFIWITPADEKPTDMQSIGNGNATARFPTSFLSEQPVAGQNQSQPVSLQNPSKEENEKPVYTLPENATLVGSQAMTALLGRVPVNGTVTDPYPFKILIGKDNLTANGIELPEVEGAVVSGSASGDWTLSCVRGQVNSITFVFQDGSVRTLPGSGQKTNNIGWLSDENGIPCISGERKSNAGTYLPTLFALSAMNSAGEAVNESQQTAQTNGSGGLTTALTGNAGQAALGKAMSGGMKDMSEWLKQRYSQTFDAVYVPPGARVVVHITQNLAIDYETTGRKVRYGVSEPAQYHQEALD